ncbi:MAG: hypothetical protein OXF01_14430 [Gemmatimonadetes bacterium]|nr:hypothetical protein [Gemmatimonadota bacterium]
MSLAKRPARIMAVAALMALLIGPMLFGASSALAQGAPANYYGGGLAEGDTVTASVDGAECGSATADASGGWLISIGAANDCGAVDGSTVNFAVNGEAAAQSVVYSAGGTPDDIANGITLTVDAMEVPEPQPTPAPVTVPSGPVVGNAGLVTQSGTSALAVLALGALALAGVAGARTVTGRID